MRCWLTKSSSFAVKNHRDFSPLLRVQLRADLVKIVDRVAVLAAGYIHNMHQQAAAVALRWMASLPSTVRTTSPDTPAPGLDAAGPSWERVTGRSDGSEQECGTPPRLQPPPGPYLGR